MVEDVSCKIVLNVVLKGGGCQLYDCIECGVESWRMSAVGLC